MISTGSSPTGRLYDPTTIPGLNLSANTATTLATHPQGTNLVRLNRWLLLDAYPDEMTALSKQLLGVRSSVHDLIKEMLNGDDRDREADSHTLAVFQQALFNDVHDTFQAFQEQDDSAPLKVEDLAAGCSGTGLSASPASICIQVYPKKDVVAAHPTRWNL